MKPNDCAVYLSLDGGYVERQVVLVKGSSPEPLKGKTILGATFTLEVACKSLLAEKPVMFPPTLVVEELIPNGDFEDILVKELLTDGGFEAGIFGGAWGKVETGGTASIDTAVYYSGTKALHLRRNVTSGSLYAGNLFSGLIAGKYYRISARVKNLNILEPTQMQLQVGMSGGTKNGYYWDGLTETWLVGVYNAIYTSTTVPGVPTLGQTWTYLEEWMLVDPAIAIGDSCYLSCHASTNSVGDVMYDEVSVDGPYDKPGRLPSGWLAAGAAADLLVENFWQKFGVNAGWAVKFSKVQANTNYVAFYPNNTFKLKTGAWYRLRVTVLGNGTITDGLNAQIYNLSHPSSTGANPMALYMVHPASGESGNVWGWGIGVTQNLSAAKTMNLDVYFRGPDTKAQPTLQPHKPDDLFQFRLHGIQDNGEGAFYDNVSIQGPYLRPGVPSW